MFVADGYGNSGVAKFDKDGNFVKYWGRRGNQPGLSTLHVTSRNESFHPSESPRSQFASRAVPI
jgi:hypothetical protein